MYAKVDFIGTPVKKLAGRLAAMSVGLGAIGCASVPDRARFLATLAPGQRAVIERAVAVANGPPDRAPRWRFGGAVALGGLLVERYRLDEELVLLLNVDRWAPAIVYASWYGVGWRDAPQGAEGAMHVAFQLMRSTPEDVHTEQLAELGAIGHAGLDPDTMYFGAAAPALASIGGPLPILVAAEATRQLSADDARFLAARRRARSALDRYRGRSIRDHLEEALLGSLYAPGSLAAGYGLSALARRVGLATLDTTRAVDAARARLGAAKRVLVVVGHVDRAQLMLAIGARHAGPKGPPPPAQDLARPPMTTTASSSGRAASIAIRVPARSEHLMLGWPLPPAEHPDHLALEALAWHLGGGPSSALGRALRTIGARAADAGTVAYRHAGAFEVTVALDPSTTATSAEAAVLRIIRRASREPVSADELESIRAELQTRSWLDVERLTGRAETIARAELVHGGVEALPARLERIPSLEPADLVAAATAYLSGQPYVRVIARPRPPPPAPTSGPSAGTEAR